jgi:hypothetical protein
VYIVKTETQNKSQVSITQVLLTGDKEDNMKKWELSFGLFEGLLFGYRNYPDVENNKIDHVLYIFIFDICLTLQY